MSQFDSMRKWEIKKLREWDNNKMRKDAAGKFEKQSEISNWWCNL